MSRSGWKEGPGEEGPGWKEGSLRWSEEEHRVKIEQFQDYGPLNWA